MFAFDFLDLSFGFWVKKKKILPPLRIESMTHLNSMDYEVEAIWTEISEALIRLVKFVYMYSALWRAC